MQNSPFPGMDPFIEGYGWSSFHLNFISTIMRFLAPKLPEQYTLGAEMNTVARDLLEGTERTYRPDIGIVESDKAGNETPLDTATINPPSVYKPLHDTRQRTLTIRTLDGAELVTAIKVLSLTNKKGTGLTAYREKRAELIRNQVNLVEIDLLRGGIAPYLAEDWPRATYYVQAIKAVPDMVGVWAIGLDERLPTVGVPLLPGDLMLSLDLQEVFTEVYRFGLYGRSLRYAVDRLMPVATEAEKTIVARYLNA